MMKTITGEIVGNRLKSKKIIVLADDGRLYELPRMSAKQMQGDSVIFHAEKAREVKNGE